MPPLSATQETLPVTHLVGYSPTESSLLVTSSIAKGMDVMSQSGALALEAVWTLYPQRPRDSPSAGSPAFSGRGRGKGRRRKRVPTTLRRVGRNLCPAHRCYATRRKPVTKLRLFV